MNKLTLSVLLLSACITCYTTEDLIGKPINLLEAHDQGERKRNVEFGLRMVIFNGVSTRYIDKSFLSVVDKIFAVTQSRFKYFIQVGKEMANDAACGRLLEEYMKSEMFFLKDGFLEELMRAYPVQEILGRDLERTRKLFIDVLNLFEEIHNIRIQVFRSLPTKDILKLDFKGLLDETQERSFQRNADLLKIGLNVHAWFERMRNVK